MQDKVIKNIIQYRRYICLIHLVVCVLLYCLLNIFSLSRESSFVWMQYFGYYSIAVFATLLLFELRYPGIDLFMIFIGFSFLRLLMPTITMAEEGLKGETFMFHRNFTDYVFPCVVGMNIYYVLFILLLTQFSKDKMLSIKLDAIDYIPHKRLFIFLIYIVGFLVRLIPSYISFMDTLRSYMSLFPTLALLIYAFIASKKNNKKDTLLFTFLVIVEISYAVFFGFYKGAVVRPFIFFLMYYYLKIKNSGGSLFTPKFILSVGFFALFLFFFIYPFMELKRYESGWDPATDITYYDYSNIEIFEKVVKGDYEFDKEEQQSGMADRQNAIPTNAYFYMAALNDGFQTRIVKSSLTLPIPRWLGGNYGLEDNQGYLTNSYLHQGNYYVSPYGIHSSAYIGLFGGAFFWGGWLAVLLMCSFNAWFIPRLLSISMNNIKNPFALLILFHILMESLACFEETSDGGLNRLKTYCIFLIIAIIYNRLFLNRKLILQ